MRYPVAIAAIAVVGTAVAGARMIGPAPTADWSVALVQPARASEADQHSYLSHEQGVIQDWQHRVQELQAKADRKTDKVQRQAAENVQQAWQSVKTHWANLQEAGADGWDNAKQAYQESITRLKKAWADVSS